MEVICVDKNTDRVLATTCVYSFQCAYVAVDCILLCPCPERALSFLSSFGIHFSRAIIHR
jgi:hypothetical protein